MPCCSIQVLASDHPDHIIVSVDNKKMPHVKVHKHLMGTSGSTLLTDGDGGAVHVRTEVEVQAAQGLTAKYVKLESIKGLRGGGYVAAVGVVAPEEGPHLTLKLKLVAPVVFATDLS